MKVEVRDVDERNAVLPSLERIAGDWCIGDAVRLGSKRKFKTSYVVAREWIVAEDLLRVFLSERRGDYFR